MADNIQLEFVTPEEIVASKPVEMVVIPGVEGDIGVLAGHSQIIVRLRPGMVCVFSNGQIQERVFVEGGIAEINAEQCVLLIERAITEQMLDKDKLMAELSDLRDKFANQKTDILLQKKINIVETQIGVIQNPPYA